MIQKPRPAPWSLILLGERHVNRILVCDGGGDRNYSADELQRLFPEAHVGFATNLPFFEEPEKYPFP